MVQYNMSSRQELIPLSVTSSHSKRFFFNDTKGASVGRSFLPEKNSASSFEAFHYYRG